MSKALAPKESIAEGTGFMPGIAVDAVIFGFHKKQLRVLLLEYKRTGLFALPGGFIKENEDLNTAAARVVKHRTGLNNIYLDQFYVFGDFSRYNPAPLKQILASRGVNTKGTDHWLLKRFITVGYYALVDFTRAIPLPDNDSDVCAWYQLNELPKLMLDHELIVTKALESLQQSLDQRLTGFNLLPQQFTMGELQEVYETILDKNFLRAAFQRKILSLGILEVIAKKFTGKAHKAPYLYQFKKK